MFWINPVADLRIMNLIEDVGGRICGTDYMFTHALDPIPEDERDDLIRAYHRRLFSGDLMIETRHARDWEI